MQRSNADNRHDRHFRISSTWISILLSFVLGGIFMSQIRQVEMIGRHNNYQTMAEEASFMMKTNSLVGKWKDEERRTSNERGVVTEDGWVCKGFFTVMATAFTNDHGERDACNKLFNGRRYYRSLLKDHNQQMLKMNTTLTIFTTWTKEQLSERPELCRLDHLPGLKVQSFDPIQILKNQQFTNEQIEWIQHWLNAKSKERTQRYKHHRVAARLADLWRVVLAKEYQMAYIELDMLLLNPYKETYLQHSNVAVPVWSEENGMLEIQNSGFCFSRQQLNVILQKQQSIIQFRGPSQAIADNYELYTELGAYVCCFAFPVPS